MADAVLEVEARFINNLSAGLKSAEKDIHSLETESVSSMGHMAEAHGKAEHAAHHHAEVFGLSMREIKKSSREGMMGVAVASEIGQQGFVGAKGALEAFNLSLVAMASGPIVGGLIALGAIISAVADHFKKLKEAAEAVDWYGEADKVEHINTAFLKAIELQETWGKAAWLASNQLKAGAQGAEAQFKDLTGTSSKAFIESIGGMEKAKELLQDLTTAAEDYTFAIEEINKKENEKNIAQAETELAVANTIDPVKKAKIESEARMKQMDLDQEIKKSKMLEYSAQITQLEKALETKKAVGGEEGKKAREEIEKKLEIVRQGYEKEEGQVEAGETVIALTRARAAAEVTKAQAEENKKEEYAQTEMHNAALASQREHQAKIRAASRKEQDEAVKADEEHTKQIYEARAKLEDEQQKNDPVARLKTQMQRELDAVGMNEAAKLAIKKRYALLEADLQKEAILRSGAVVSQGLSAVMGLYHHHGAEYKVWAEAKNAVDTALSAQAAYESAASIPYVGWIMGPAAAAAAVAVGMENAAKIKSAHFALGTLNAPGGMALVGERGPEMVQLPQGARVFDHNETSRMQGGITHTGDVVFQLNFPQGVTQQQGAAVGQAAGEAYIRHLSGLKRDIKNIDYMNIPEMV